MVINKNDRNAFNLILDTLRRGGIVIMHCDTMYGIVGAVPYTQERIAEIKGRGHGKQFLELIPGISWLHRFIDGEMPGSLKKYWPGTLTVIFPDRKGGTIALRVPDDAFLQKLILALGEPVFSTSVNKTGERPLFRIDRIISLYGSKVDLIVDSGDYNNSRPSTIVDVSSEKILLVRQGVIIIDKTGI